MRVTQMCSNGHVLIRDEEIARDECLYCDSNDIRTLTNPFEIMNLAFEYAGKDRELMHQLADSGILERLKQFDRSFAQRWEELESRGFWYS